jgi:hypothetical protein
MDPQMLMALGLGGQGRPNPLMPGALPATGPHLPFSGNPTQPIGSTPPQAPQPMGSNAPPAATPGMMPSSSPQTAPMAGTYENGPKMAGDSQQAPGNQEPTGENPQRPPPSGALPHFPRNRFGAMLLPPGGQINQGGGQGLKSPFDLGRLLSMFLQRSPQAPQGAGMTGMTGGMPGGGLPGGMPGA